MAMPSFEAIMFCTSAHKPRRRKLDPNNRRMLFIVPVQLSLLRLLPLIYNAVQSIQIQVCSRFINTRSLCPNHTPQLRSPATLPSLCFGISKLSTSFICSSANPKSSQDSRCIKPLLRNSYYNSTRWFVHTYPSYIPSRL